MSRTTTRRILFSVLALVVCAISAFAWAITRPGLYRTYDSPDGRFSVLLMRTPQPLGMMPGDSGGAPGFVRLVDNRTGDVLGEEPVEMVQIVEDVRWSEDRASIKLVADWPLPAR